MSDQQGLTGVDVGFADFGQSLLAASMEAAPIALLVIDDHGRMACLNRAAETLFGYARHELVGQPVELLVPERYRSDHPALRQTFLASPSARQMGFGRDLFGVRKDRSEFPVEIGLTPIQTDDGLFVLSAILDLTERKQLEQELRLANEVLEQRVWERTAAAEQRARELTLANQRLTAEAAERHRAELALHASERRYRQLTEGTRDAIVVANEEGVITLFNPAAQVTFGYTEEEVLGQPLTLLMPLESHEAHRQGLRRYRETRQSRVVGHTVELPGRRKGGEVFPLELSLTALELPEEGLVFLGSIRDITERRRMQTHLVQTEKLASLGMLSAGIAHEINNPLAYVANNLTVLQRHLGSLLGLVGAYEQAGPDLAETRPDLAERIEELDLPYLKEHLMPILEATRGGVKRVADIVRNLRGFARLDQAEAGWMNLHDGIASSLELIRGRLNRRQIRVTEDHGNIPQVCCSQAQINQVILNLLVNAIQAIESGGKESGQITIRTRSVDCEAILEVQDDGPGIPPEVLPMIFDPFFTTKPVGEGVGLGLSISHGIVEDHGGRIEVESTSGNGSLFRIVLPVQRKLRGVAP